MAIDSLPFRTSDSRPSPERFACGGCSLYTSGRDSKHHSSHNVLNQQAINERGIYLSAYTYVVCEPVWPSGKALGW